MGMEDDFLMEDEAPAAKGARRGKSKRKMIAKIYKIIDNTPRDDRGLVPGTTFSVAGVERLMTMLKERASDTSKAGSKMAIRIQQFLAPSSEEDAAICNASIEKLKMISGRIEAFRDKRKGTGEWING